MNSNREELLFGLALLKPPLERAAFLDRECADDAALRQCLETFLAVHDQPDPLLTGFEGLDVLAPKDPAVLESRKRIATYNNQSADR